MPVDIYPHNIWTRAKWQQELDAARVPQELCAKVSLGAELDRFHVEMAKGFGPNSVHAAQRLEERIKTYVAAVQASYPGWARRVALQIGDRAESLQDEFTKIGRAREGWNKAILLVKNSYEGAELDIEDWMRAGGGTRLQSRYLDMLVAGLREIAVHGQRLVYVTDTVDKGVCSEARRYWTIMDGPRSPDHLWLEGVNDIRMRLRAV